MVKKHLAIIGATGQVGSPLTAHLLQDGHSVTIVVRKRHSGNEAGLAAHEANGAMVVVCPDMKQADSVATAIDGCDTVIAAVPGSKQIISDFEPVWLSAAVAAGASRYVPTEFGCHTRSLDMGDGEIFDNKKRFHELLFASGIDWTLFYNGGFFDYFLPNLRYFPKITTFGDMELPIYTHDIADVGRIAALALADDRTLNRCVQMDFNALTQTEMLALLKEFWPDYPFEYDHFSSEYIIEMKEKAGDTVTAKKGAETDRERWGINYVIYVIGKLAGFTDETCRASELFPDYVCKRPEDALRDPAFVFDAG